MSNSKVRVGVIGTGWGVDVLTPALLTCPDIEVTAICSKRIDRAQLAAARLGIGTAFDDYRQLIAHGAVDLVCVCTPPATHYEIAMAVIEAGLHVFVTKPLGSSVEEARALRDAAVRRRVIHAIDAGGRYVPTYRYMRDLVAQGFIGTPRLVSAMYFSSGAVTPGGVIYYSSWVSKRPDGGILRTAFIHQLDRLRFIFGEIGPTRGFTATLVRDKPILATEHNSSYGLDANARVVGYEPATADDSVLIHGSLASGAPFSAVASWAVHHAPGDRLEAYGDEGTLLLGTDGVLRGGRSSDPFPRVMPVPEGYALPNVAADANSIELVYGAGRASLYAEYAQDLANVILGRPDLGLYPTFVDGARIIELQREVAETDSVVS